MSKIFQSKYTGQEIENLLDDVAHKLQEVTYAELVELRNNSKLEPGKQYRIIDYITTTSQEDTMSAKHPFDVVVTAHSKNILSEFAQALPRKNDQYFENCKVTSWTLKYCLDNDITRFAWADTKDGKGVIFYMEDEFENVCSYDFKNIMFKRWKITSNHEIHADHLDFLQSLYVGFKPNAQVDTNMHPNLSILNESDYYWFYTFTVYSSNLEYPSDASLNQMYQCSYNRISSNTESNSNSALKLNNIVIVSPVNVNQNIFDEHCFSMTFYIQASSNDIWQNHFGQYSRGLIFMGAFLIYQNDFGYNFQRSLFSNSTNKEVTISQNILQGYVREWIVKNAEFYYNDIASDTNRNVIHSSVFCNAVIDHYFNDNTITGNFGELHIRNSFQNNIVNGWVGGTIGAYCQNNTITSAVGCSVGYGFGDNIANGLNMVTFSNVTKYNTFNNIQSSQFAVMCQSNDLSNVKASTFGIGFRGNVFKNTNSTTGNNGPGITGCTFGNYVWFNNFYTTGSSAITALHVQDMLQGKSTSYNHIEVPSGSTAQVKVARNSSGQIKVYNEADLVN